MSFVTKYSEGETPINILTQQAKKLLGVSSEKPLGNQPQFANVKTVPT